MQRDVASFHDRFVAAARLRFEPSGLEIVAEQSSGETKAEAGETMQSAVWQAGVVLADCMQQPALFPDDHWRGKRVVELGAGCG